MIRAFFNRLTLREKVLLTSFVWVILIIIGFSLLSSTVQTARSLQQKGSVLELHQRWYAKAPLLDQEREEILQQLNPEKTFSGASLAGKIDALARSSRVNSTIKTPTTRSDDKLNLHTMRVSLQKNAIADIITFEEKLQSEWPYIKVERLQLGRDNRNPDRLDATYIINSFEFKEEAVN